MQPLHNCVHTWVWIQDHTYLYVRITDFLIIQIIFFMYFHIQKSKDLILKRFPTILSNCCYLILLDCRWTILYHILAALLSRHWKKLYDGGFGSNSTHVLWTQSHTMVPLRVRSDATSLFVGTTALCKHARGPPSSLAVHTFFFKFVNRFKSNAMHVATGSKPDF